MKFLIISEGGDGIGLATRLKAEGHEVKIWLRDHEVEHRGDGFVDKAEDASFGEVVVADCTGAGAILDTIRNSGGFVIGGSALHDRLESDRSFATQVMKQAGIKVPMAKSFHDWEQAIDFVRAHEETRFVFKPEGVCSGVIPSQVTHDNEELLENIEHYKTLIGAREPEFTLQEFVEGTAISTEGWFDGHEWLLPFNHTIERKQFLNGDLGPSGGCTGNVVWPCGPDDFVVKELVKITDFLQEHDYRGPIDLNAVVNDEGVYALEFTPRFGYDAFPTYLYGLYAGNFGYLLDGIARGSFADTMEVLNGFSAGVRISLPPWPCEKFHAEEGVPIRGLRDIDLAESFYAYDVKKSDDRFVSCGGYGIIGVVNGFGNNVGEAFAQAYRRVEKIKLNDMQYRTDLYEQCYKDYREFELLGSRDNGWIGVDLDGTLAKYGSWTKFPGEPIPTMVNRVKRWLGQGREVRIVTARVAPLHKDRTEQLTIVHNWVKEHIGHPLEVIAYKDPSMRALWDDRVIQVEQDTGKRVV